MILSACRSKIKRPSKLAKGGLVPKTEPVLRAWLYFIAFYRKVVRCDTRAVRCAIRPQKRSSLSAHSLGFILLSHPCIYLLFFISFTSYSVWGSVDFICVFVCNYHNFNKDVCFLGLCGFTPHYLTASFTCVRGCMHEWPPAECPNTLPYPTKFFLATPIRCRKRKTLWTIFSLSLSSDFYNWVFVFFLKDRNGGNLSYRQFILFFFSPPLCLFDFSNTFSVCWLNSFLSNNYSVSSIFFLPPFSFSCCCVFIYLYLCSYVK